MTKSEMIEKVIEGLENAKEVIEVWIPMFEQHNSPSTIDCAIELLKEQPHWISVKERMPEKEGFYLVSAERGNYIPWIAEMRIFMGIKGFCSPAAQPVVGAWMSLPDPYNAEQKG